MADGEACSCAHLARELAIDRGEVARLVQSLRGLGIDIHEAAGPDYRLPAPVELLDAGRISSALRDDVRTRIHRLEIPFEVDSTNTRLLARAPPPRGLANVCSAELQHAGRGRRGRAWISPFGGSLVLSLGWSFPDAGGASPALSLAVGIAVARAAERFGTRELRVKWPNDLWLDDRKLGGVLVELRAEAGGAAHVVIGIGLNLKLSNEHRRRMEAQGMRIATLSDAGPAMVARNGLAAALMEELVGMLDEFERCGFAAFHAEWTRRDALRDRGARVHGADGVREGTARGVDEDGALLLEVGGELQRHVSGEASLRLHEGGA
ncbi:MAG TPA: biotin--[acetyl-CoA-carboxylase] ligase [Steroidobacteraceae bacterium]|jgi:BirA family biotin operon repressor/biotin-[acetyl-CoA-carboxylase] ligase|nr:biotin--[acetyl-CoA-carboxylase] ligase [Steroidobacteraceae bacterium]